MDGKLVININPDHWYYVDPDKGDRTGLCWQFLSARKSCAHLSR
jgi:hypothetical protein